MKTSYALGLLLFLITLVTFSSLRRAEFVNVDDPTNVVLNPYFTGKRGPHPLAKLWTEPYAGMYIPVTYSLWYAERELGHNKPRVFHAGNVLLHSACVLLAFLLLLRFVPSPIPAFFGALVFALHPLQVEAVGWITGMKDLLFSFFSLASLLLYFGAKPEARTWRSARLPLAFLCFALALLSKPTAVAVPLVALALEIGWESVSPRESLRRLWPWLGACVAIVWVTSSVQRLKPDVFVTPLAERPLIAADALAFYVGKLLYPVSLGIDYGRTPQQVLDGQGIYFLWLVPLLVVIGLSLGAARRKQLSALVVFTAVLLPVLGFVPFVFQRFSTVADRYVYLAMLGPSLLVAYFISSRRSRAWLAVAALLVVLGATITVKQCEVWKDSVSMLTQAVKVNAESQGSRYNLASVLSYEGRHEEAADHLRKAALNDPGSLTLFLDLIGELAELGRFEEAQYWVPKVARVRAQQPVLDQLNHELTVHDSPVEISSTLADFLESRGRRQEASAFRQHAVALRSHSSSRGG